MEIHIQATMGECEEFVATENGKRGSATVVIAPLKVEANEQTGKIQVTNGCNFWESCQNIGCWYSQAARKNKGTGGKVARAR